MYLSLCLICKDDGSYLPEWLEYYLLMGVEHFYVFNNRSHYPLHHTLQPWIGRNQVTLEDYPAMDTHRQARLYADCLREHGTKSKWMGFIDLDEFLVVKTGENIPQFLQRYEKYGGLGAFWYCFGSDGHTTRPPNQIESYTKRSEDRFDPNFHIKSFVQCQYASGKQSPTPHHFLYKEGYCTVDENGIPIMGPSRKNRASELIQLNHYLLRSQEEFQHKIHRGGGNSWHRDETFFSIYNEKCNKIEDKTILEILEGKNWKIPSFDPETYKLETAGPPGSIYQTPKKKDV